MACETGTTNLVYPPTTALSHNINISNFTNVTLSAFIKGKWVESKKITVSGNVEILFNLKPIPFYDASKDITYLNDIITSSVDVVENPSPSNPFTSFINSKFIASPNKVIPQGDMSKYISDAHGTLTFLGLFCLAGINGDAVFQITETGYIVLQPVSKLTIDENLDENIFALDYVINEGKNYDANGASPQPFVPDFLHNPENENNRSIQFSSLPLLLNSNIASDKIEITVENVVGDNISVDLNPVLDAIGNLDIPAVDNIEIKVNKISQLVETSRR